MEEVGGEQNEIAGLEMKFQRLQRKRRMQPRVGGVEIGVSALPRVEESKHAAVRVLGDRLAGPDTVHPGPRGKRMIVGDKGACVAGDVKPGVVLEFQPTQRNRLNRLSKVSACGVWLGEGLRYSSLSRWTKSVSSSRFRRSQGSSRVCRIGTANRGLSLRFTILTTLPVPWPRTGNER